MNIKEFLAQKARQKFATECGTAVHKKLQHIVIDNGVGRGDTTLATAIKSRPELLPFFGTNAKTEVPIVGKINGEFITRRVDRLVVLPDKTVLFMDYKTDTNRGLRREKYIIQIREYATLLRAVYPEHTIHGFILWTHDFILEEIS